MGGCGTENEDQKCTNAIDVRYKETIRQTNQGLNTEHINPVEQLTNARQSWRPGKNTCGQT